MPSLADLVLSRTTLDTDDAEHVQQLVADWQLLADLAFSDLVLWVRTELGWLAVAHKRPTTGPTAYPEEVVGVTQALAGPLELAWQTGAIVGDGHDRDSRQELVPVRRQDHLVAVLTRNSSWTSNRVPSQLELAYLTSASELLQMVSEGTFPFPGQDPDPEHSPRVGDGLLRLDRTGHVVYASPNALSAYRRLGVSGDLVGAHLGRTIALLTRAPGQLDEPRGSAALAAALRFREQRDSEVEANGAVVLLRALPMVPGGEPRGALVLVRDVTELRRRDRQILGKDATIREIHHRVKNNLQTVAALLRMQARRMTDAAAQAALQESVRRVTSIAMVHETLSLTLGESVDFDSIADGVLAMCADVAAIGAPVTVVRRGSFGVLVAEVATPLAMVLNELVQNAVEHAYLAEGGGRIDVVVQRTAVGLEVQVLDSGAGLPDGFSLSGSTRLGLQIVRTLVEGELRGTVVIAAREGGGTRALLEVPLGSDQDRSQPS